MITTHRRFVALLALLPLVGGCIVDQSSVGPNADLVEDVGANVHRLAQTFTAGVSGDLRGVNVDIEGAGTATLVVAIRTVRQGPLGALPSETVLGSVTLDSSSAALSRFIAFPHPITSTAGVQYAIVVEYPGAFGGPAEGSWTGESTDAYPGGNLAGCVFVPAAEQEVCEWAALTDRDFHFRTYVELDSASGNTLEPDQSAEDA